MKFVKSAWCNFSVHCQNLNAVFINEGLTLKDRLIKLNQIAIQQMSILEDIKNKKLLK